jgi:5'-AMP-activated protein kinase regulatory beta subunit
MGNTQGVPPGGQGVPSMGGGGDPGPGGGGGGYPRSAYGGQQAGSDFSSSPSPFEAQQPPPQMHNNDKSGPGRTSSSDLARTSSDMVIDQQGASVENWLDDDTVPTVFRWEHGGRQVYITGTFNGWSRQIPMHRSGNDFTYIHNLKRGKHAFKFIVDDEWRFAPDQPTVADIEGRINNFIDVTGFKAYTGDREFEKEKAAAAYGAVASDSQETEGDLSDADAQGMSTKPDQDGEVFSHNMPDVDDYTKEPPPLPPHLRHIILNKPPQLQDTAALPVPQHVALNHLYCTAIKDNMMVLGITQRYKTKFVTTVYYSPCASK